MKHLADSARFGRLYVLAAVVLALAAAPAAGGLAEARQLLAEKKFDQVDRALGRELQAKSPSQDVLRVSLDAAVGGGRFVTAQRRMTTLLKISGQRDLDMVYRGAQIAELAGDDGVALSRYVDYAQRQSARSDKLRHALTHLAVNGKFPQLYRKYVRLYGTGEMAWSLGIALLGRLVRDGEVNPTFDMAQTLMESFPAPQRVTEVHRRLLYAAENNKLGREDQNVYVLPMRIIARTVPSDYGPFSRLLARAATKISKDDLLEILFAHQVLVKKPLQYELFRHFGEMSLLGSDEKKLAAGRRFLALLGVYSDVRRNNPRALTRYITTIRDQTGVFRIKGRELVTEAVAARLLDAAAAQPQPSYELRRVAREVTERYVEQPKRTALLARHAALVLAQDVDRLLVRPQGQDRDKQIAEGTRTIERFMKGRSLAEAAQAHGTLLRWWYNAAGDKKAAIAAARTYMDLYPATFNVDAIRYGVLDSKLLTAGEKVAVIREQLIRTGVDGRETSMGQLISRHVKGRVRKIPEYKALVDLFNANKVGTDVLSRYACRATFKRSRRGDKAAALVGEFLKDYATPVPLGPAACKGRNDVLALRVMNACYYQLRGRDAKRQIAKAWLERASGPGEMLIVLAQYVSPDVLAGAVGRLGGAIDSGDLLWAGLADLQLRPTGGASPLTKFYQKMGPALALRHVARQMGYPSQHRSKWSDSPEALVGELDKVVAMRGFKVTDSRIAAFVLEGLGGHNFKAPVSDNTVDALWRGFTSAGGAADQGAETRVHLSMLRIAQRSGRDVAVVGRMTAALARIARMPLVDQARQIESICGSLRMDSERSRPTAGPYALAAEKLADVYSRMPDADWAFHRVRGRTVQDMGSFADWSERHKREYSRDGRLIKAAETITAILMARLAAGARVTDSGSLGWLVKRCGADLAAALAAKQPQRVVRTAALYFRAMSRGRNDWDSVYRDDIIDLARTLEKARAWEMLHVVLEQLHRANPPQALAKAVARYRTAAANNITGLVAVSRSDKTYPLHQAAQLLALGSETRAWHLTRTRLNLLKESWSSFEPKYVAWCIEQMRKSKLTKEALDLAFTVLLRENDIEPETAGRILLARGDIYRDRRSYDVAKIEYRALRQNPRYRDTVAGTQATYHLVNLMIDTAQHTTAQQLIERLIDSVDLPVKAEGYFLMARLAYERKNYETAAENIDKVRMCVSDHVEAAFLDGLLKLKLPGGMINPEVEIGTAATRRILIPGEELSLKLQDANLSIARDEKAIPIIVRTTGGKDEEQVDLRSLVGGNNLFTGTLRTALGQARQRNGVLEVTGADRVSYVIADAFQRKNKINYPPKYLEIRTTGQLAASAGEILTPEEIEKRRLQQGLAAAASAKLEAAWQRTAGNMVRPGNEIYLQVHDIDRDVTNGKDTVTVKLTTTNGDVIEAAKLTETSEHSAIFRAAVKTAVPLPKADASDTFEGKDPATAINSTRRGTWSSLADGAKPKWVGVDMMNSHEVKRVTAAVPDVSQVRSVRLMARLARDYREIASYPVAGVQRGLRAERFGDKGMTRLLSEATVTSLAAAPPKGTAAVRYTGVFVAKVPGKHTFTVKTTGQVSLSVGGKEIIVPKAPTGGEATYTGEAQIAVDGAVIAGRGETPFVLVYVPAGKGDSLSLIWSAGGKTGPVSPAAMYPGGEAQRRDELAVQYAQVDDIRTVGASAAAIGRYFADLGRKGTIYVPAPSYSAKPAEKGILQMTGSFHVPKARYMTLKLTGKSFDNAESWGRLLVDGKEVLVRATWKPGPGVADVQQVAPTARVKLTKGVHRLRVALRGHGVCAATVLYEDDAGKFVPMPSRWFSVDHHAQIAASVSPEGHIGLRGGKLACELTAPTRLRAVRWVFDDYEGGAVAVGEIGVVDADGKTLIPVKRDFTSATTNDVLEIAPGDRVTALYIDEKRPEGGSPNRRASLATGYYNGSIVIANEVITDTGGGMETQYYPARRCGVGDALAILVDEADNDVTAKRDTMDVLVETSGAQRMTLKALEIPSEIAQDAEGKDVEAHHAGRFLALLRLGKKAGKGTLAVAPGDRITVSYMDRENSDPGVAVYRRYELFEGGDPLVEQIDFERYTSQLVRTEVKKTLGRTRRSDGDDPQFTYVRLLSRTNAPREGAKETDPPVTSIRGPLAFSIMYPAMAKHTASTIEAAVWAESDLKAAEAAKPKRAPRILEVRMPCGSGGLDEGVFSATVKLQVSLPGASADLKIDEALAILDTRTGAARKKEQDEDAGVLIVVPGDVIHVKYTDPAGSKKEITARIQVLSEGDVEVLDAKRQIELEQIRLGEKFHIRVDDTDRDTTPERDEVTVKLTSKCGDTMNLTLNETLGRSGVFTGWVEPKLIGDKVDGKLPAADKTDEVLSAYFGDEITFAYVDPAGVNSAVPVTHTRLGRIIIGSDAKTDLFSKQYKDSEMAVKTSFLMAEALFELAKQKRDLKQPKEAEKLIARGKKLLEVTIRDYPGTKLKVQSRFLLANLAQELGKHSEAVAKYSQVIQMAPQSEQASKSQFKMAQCYEQLGKFDQACEEYVKVTYVYASSPLAPKARMRMGAYYMKLGQKLKTDETKQPESMQNLRIAAKIFAQFRTRHPVHALAAKALFLSGQCSMELKDYRTAAETLAQVVEDYPTQKAVRAEAMYWCAESLYNIRDYKGAYRMWTELIWAYPEVRRAKEARGRLASDRRMIRIAEQM